MRIFPLEQPNFNPIENCIFANCRSILVSANLKLENICLLLDR